MRDNDIINKKEIELNKLKKRKINIEYKIQNLEYEIFKINTLNWLGNNFSKNDKMVESSGLFPDGKYMND